MDRDPIDLVEVQDRINRAAEEQRAQEAMSREEDRKAENPRQIAERLTEGIGSLAHREAGRAVIEEAVADARRHPMGRQTLGDIGGHPVSLVGDHAEAYARFQRSCLALKASKVAYDEAAAEYRAALEAFSQLTEAAAAKR